MAKWLLVFTLLIQAHFAASYLVPLNDADKGAMGGLLQWAWPWGNGDNSPLGQVESEGESPLAALFLAMATSVLLIMAAMAVAGWWVPTGWWRGLASAGAISLLVLMGLFFGPTKIIPILFALGTLFITIVHPDVLHVD